MQFKKRVATVILLVAILSTILGGCKSMEKTYFDGPELTEETLQYMKEKYGKTFTVEREFQDGNMWCVVLRQEENPDWWIEADYHIKEKYIVDNYVSFLRDDDIENLAQEIADSAIEAETKVYFFPEGKGGSANSTYNPDTPIEEYIRELESGRTSVTLYINETTTEKATLYLEKLAQEMKNRDVRFSYYTILVEQETFDMVSKENEDVSRLYVVNFSLDNNYQPNKINWREGDNK